MRYKLVRRVPNEHARKKSSFLHVTHYITHAHMFTAATLCVHTLKTLSHLYKMIFDILCI